MALQKVVSGVIGDNSVGITQLNVSDGSNGQALTTNGSGTLSFSTISSGLATSGGTLTGNLTMGGMILKPSADGGSIGLNRNPDNGNHVGDSSLRRFQLNGPDSTGGDFIQIQSYNSSGTHQGNVNIQDGNIGIGVTPDELLVVEGDIKIRSTNKLHFTNTSDQTSIHAPASNTIAISTNSSERLRIDSSGVLMVGTTDSTTLGSPEKYMVVGSTTNNDQVSYTLNVIEGTNNRRTSFFLDDNDGTYGIKATASTGVPEFIIKQGGTEAMRIDSSRDLTVGTSSLGFHFDVSTQTFSTNFGTGGNLTLAVTNSSGTGVGGEIFLGGSTRGDTLKNNIVFRNASSSEKMRMTENGSFNIGTGGGEANGSTGGCSFSADTSDRRNFICATTGTGTLELIEFRNPNGTVGDIKVSGTSTSYSTSSDYRLKENVKYDWDATSRLKQLKPARFNFKADADTTLDGFIAHEVQDIVPEAISGKKDGEKMQGIDQSKLVPLLTKAIQEQQTIIEDLKSRIETLEG
jgi:hypothetical protein